MNNTANTYIDEIYKMIDDFDRKYENIYLLRYSNFGDLMNALEDLYDLYNDIKDYSISFECFLGHCWDDVRDVDFDKKYEECCLELRRISDVKDSLYKICKAQF